MIKVRSVLSNRRLLLITNLLQSISISIINKQNSYLKDFESGPESLSSRSNGDLVITWWQQCKRGDCLPLCALSFDGQARGHEG